MRNRVLPITIAGVVVLALALAAMAATGTVPVPQEPAVPPVDPTNGFPLAFQTVRGSPFNSTPSACHLCPTDVHQGDLDDCYVLSSLAAIAVVSPGTIQDAVGYAVTDTAGIDVYPVHLHPGGAGAPVQILMVEHNFPAIASPTGFWNFVNNRQYSSSVYWKNLLSGQSAFFYAQPVASWWNSVKGNTVTWPMLMEKAFSYTKGGYPALRAGGGISYQAMQVITGQPGGGYLIEPNQAESRVTSVFLQDSPALQDTGSHSILGGLLRGDLKAVQPSLKICITPSGRPGTACTAVCAETHSCRGVFGGGNVPIAKGQKITVHVYDVPAGGQEHEIGTFPEDPASCEQEDHPCEFDAPDSQWIIAGPFKISFAVKNAAQLTPTGGVEGYLTTTSQIDSKLTELQSARRAITAGTIDNCTGRIPCDEFFGEGKLEHAHDYFFISYDPSGGTITLGNPHGSTIAVTLNAFLHAFQQIAYNDVQTEGSICGCN